MKYYVAQEIISLRLMGATGGIHLNYKSAVKNGACFFFYYQVYSVIT